MGRTDRDPCGLIDEKTRLTFDLSSVYVCEGQTEIDNEDGYASLMIHI